MPLSHRENYLRNASMKGHEWIPAAVHISLASWLQDTEGFQAVCRKHPTIFPHFKAPPADLAKLRQSEGRRTWTDEWGCGWQAEIEGIQGVVVRPPLADWAALKTWRPPAPPVLDDKRRQARARQREQGNLITCPLGHGFFFMRLFYLRGYDNFMMDVATEEAKLDELVEIVARHNEQIVASFLADGIDALNGGDDLGTQTASMLGPKHFRRWVLPTYKRLFAPARQAGAHVHLHHDGYVMDIIDQIIASGVTITNPQDMVNGLGALAGEVKGRVCIDLDVDRQKTLPFGSPKDIRELIRQEVLALGSPAGGLCFTAGVYPPTSPGNVDALCSALEEFRTYWVGR